MSDLIRRENAVSRISDLLMIELQGKRLPTWNEVYHAINDIPSAEPEKRWIPVTEALPKEKEMVLITNNKGHVRCGQYRGTFADKNYRWWWKNNTLEEVLAWMPLPERWRGE